MRQAFAAAVVVALSLVSQVAFAQAVDPAVRKAAEARTAARLAGDAETYGRYFLEDAVITNSTGGVETKAQRMAAVKGVKVAGPVATIKDEKYRTYGDTVIRTWRADGQDAKGQKTAQRWIEVWVKQKGEWKLASVQFTNIAQP